MKKTFLYALPLLLVSVISLSIGLRIGDEKLNLGRDQYAKVMSEVGGNQAALIDVRTKAEFDTYHAVDAEQFDLEKLKLDQLPDYPKDFKLYVYCNSGNRSSQAAEILEEAGYSNVTDLGGLEAMLDSGAVFERYPTVDADMERTKLNISIPQIGPANAPVVVIEYMDFLCPYCNNYMTQIEPTLINDYVPDGEVTIQFRNAAYKGAKSIMASSAAYCAHEQENFWTFKDLLAKGVTGLGTDATDTENIISYADQLDIDHDQFLNCVIDGKYVDLVRAEAVQARESGVNGTPMFALNQIQIPGLISLDEFRGLIEQELAR